MSFLSRETILHLAIIAFVTGAVFFTNLGQSRLWDRDEPRNAGCAAEMLARGDWVVPTFNDELRHQKPALLYWLMISAYSVLGVNEFSARFWSAVLASGTALMTYGLVRRLTTPATGLIAAVALSTSLMFDVAARAATPDSVLIFFGTLAMLLYVLGTFSRSSDSRPLSSSASANSSTATNALSHTAQWFPSNVWIVVGMYVAMGLAVLAKGPVGFLLPMAMIGMFMLVQRLKPLESNRSRWWGLIVKSIRPFHPTHFCKTLWAMRPVLAACVILLVALPWFLLVDFRTQGDFTQLFFVGEHFGRATTALENHSGGFWFYPLAILVGFFPWSVLWGPVLVGVVLAKKRFSPGDNIQTDPSFESNRNANTFLVCWVAIQVIAFSLVQTKLPSYVTPCYPALAGLAAMCLVELAGNKKRVHAGWFYAAFGGLALTGLAIIFGVGYAASNYLPGQIWLAAIGVAPLVAGIVMMTCLYRGQSKLVPVLFANGAFVFALCLFGFGTVSLDREQQSDLLMSEINDRPQAAVATYGVLESSWIYYANRPIHEIAIRKTGLASVAPPRPFWKPKPRISVDSFLAQNPDSLFIATDDTVDSIKERLPVDYQVIQTADYFLKNKRLFLLGRVAPVAGLAPKPTVAVASDLERLFR